MFLNSQEISLDDMILIADLLQYLCLFIHHQLAEAIQCITVYYSYYSICIVYVVYNIYIYTS